MSVHKSLKSRVALVRPRSVLTREERIARLEDQGRWSEGDSIYALPKVKTLRPRLKKKASKKEEEQAPEEIAEI